MLHLGALKEASLEYVCSKLTVNSKVFQRGAWYVYPTGFTEIQHTLVSEGCRHIPQEYLVNSSANRLELLAGIIDGDGHLGQGCYEVICKDASFAEQVCFLARSLGLAATCREVTKGIKAVGFTGQYHRVLISGHIDKVPVKTPHRKAAPRQQKKDVLRTGFATEYLREDWVYGFALDGDHLYLLEDFTVTHNTYCSLMIAAAMEVRTLIVVHKEDLVDQWVASIKVAWGLDGSQIGKIQGSKCDIDKPVVIAMIQTLAKGNHNAKIEKHFGMVIFDESHHLAADTFLRACKIFYAKYRLALTATPKRSDGLQDIFFAHVGPILVEANAANLTPKVLIKMSPWVVPKVCWGGEWKKLPHEKGKIMHVLKTMILHEGRNKLIVDFVLAAYKKDRHILVLSEIRETYLEHLKKLFIEAGIPESDIGFFVGGMKEKERDISKTKAVILGTYNMVSEGTDIPSLDTCVLATPRSNIVQSVGRILRLHATKREPVVFDVVDMDSTVLAGYYRSRIRHYMSMGASIIQK